MHRARSACCEAPVIVPSYHVGNCNSEALLNESGQYVGMLEPGGEEDIDALLCSGCEEELDSEKDLVRGRVYVAPSASANSMPEGPAVATMLDLSTSHAPSEAPDFGECRWMDHEMGWTVFVHGDDEDRSDERTPRWFRPIMHYAQDHDCIVINFDRDGSEHPELFRVWEW